MFIENSIHSRWFFKGLLLGVNSGVIMEVEEGIFQSESLMTAIGV
jgi:hypothetical protein